MKSCKYCEIDLTEENCYQSDWNRGGYICKECRSKQYNKNVTSDKEKQYSKIKLLNIKKEVINEYGGKCECCGQDIWQFLTIDHVGNWGNQHRKIIGNRGGKTIYQWLKKNLYPKDNFRLLCYNCNCSIGFHGFCSHEFGHNSGICNDCGVELNCDNTFEFYDKSNVYLCVNCVIKKSSKRESAKDCIIKYSSLKQRRLWNKKYTLNKRLELINGYGSICACCEENNLLYLTIDHINNDGADEKRRFNNNMFAFYKKLKTFNFPKDNYQLLCYNCNCSKGAYGQCYHDLCKDIGKETVSIDEYKNIIKRCCNNE